jgi:competence protein ComEA
MKIINLIFGLILAVCSTMAFAQMIDINTATAEQLDKGLKGIGPAKAAEIVKYREANGPFSSAEDLLKVPGIGEKTLAGIKDSVTVGGGTPAVPAVPGKPAMPGAPTMPATPGMPKTPAAPAMPAIPAKPTVPATPALPATPPLKQ